MIQWPLAKFQIDTRAFLRARAEPLLWLREMGGATSLKRPRVFQISYPQLGDHWVGICHFVRFRRFSRIPHLLNLSPVLDKTQEYRISLVCEIATILECNGELEFTGQPSELELPVHPARNGNTVLLPDCQNTACNLVAHQFDGISHTHLNPSGEEVASFLNCFPQEQLRKIGKPMTLAESMKTLSQSKLFIGVSSGMSHVAASANRPALIYMRCGANGMPDINDYKRLKRWNPYPETRFFSNLDQLKLILASLP